MNKSDIEWCDYTWNPVTGCEHECNYCYAKRIAKRFGRQNYKSEKIHILEIPETKSIDCGWDTMGFPQTKDVVLNFPYGFEPTFYKYRLDDPQKLTKPSKIFVCSMADLFGEWVPDLWIKEVFEACRKAPQHKYLFLTKNPSRYYKIRDRKDSLLEYSWLGFTTENQEDYDKRCKTITMNYGDSLFLSLEPLQGSINLKSELALWCEWVIIGAQTGPGAVAPKPEWIQSIIDQCKAANVPVFLKDNLNWHEEIKEYPEGLK